ncbi:MAG TPA: ArsR family transcriptional regulator [Chloroflexota bacterium]|jgi:predicted ArsR family transcriptional regulator|nr:ArsR family transcriptional regulator [Chloroflexota bacterium]
MYKNSDARERVLVELKRRGSATVAELARDLGVVPVTMRAHLKALAEQGLVAAADERGRVGRPRQRFALTASGHERFPNRGAGLAAELLAALRNVAGQRGVDQLLDLAAARCVAGQAPTEGSLEDRVAAATEALREESGLAEWQPAEGGFVIHDLHCPYWQLAATRDDVCRYHTQVLTRLVGAPVALERSFAHGAAHCQFRVSDRQPGQPVGVRTLSDGRLAPDRAPAN